jgi:TetR/AcrR family transcriptional regulator, mexJK operon transcriptional repressor
MKKSRKPDITVSSKSGHVSRILAAASDIFLEKGYEETSTALIAQRAKVSKRELYANFNDKRDILAAVITQLQTEMQSRADIGWSSNDEPRQVLIDAGTRLLEFINSEKFGNLLRIVVAESFRDPRSAAKFYQLGPGRGRKQTAVFMRRHMKSGYLRKADPLTAADVFLDLVISSRRLTEVILGQKHEGQDTKSHVHAAVKVFLHFYKNEPNRDDAARLERPPERLRIQARSRPGNQCGKRQLAETSSN